VSRRFTLREYLTTMALIKGVPMRSVRQVVTSMEIEYSDKGDVADTWEGWKKRMEETT